MDSPADHRDSQLHQDADVEAANIKDNIQDNEAVMDVVRDNRSSTIEHGPKVRVLFHLYDLSFFHSWRFWCYIFSGTGNGI